MDAPKRIWASPEHPDETGYGGVWIKAKVGPSVEYVRADLVDALVAEVRNLLNRAGADAGLHEIAKQRTRAALKAMDKT